jgi:hypothetical protein
LGLSAGALFLGGTAEAARETSPQETLTQETRLRADPGLSEHGAMIQAAIDARERDGGGRIYLAPGRYICGQRPIYLDPTRTSLSGDGATLDFSQTQSEAALVVASRPGAAAYGQATQSITGIALRGPGPERAMAGILCRTETPGLSSRITLRELDIEGFADGMRFADRAYLIQIYSVAIRSCVNAVMIPENLQDAGENISFFGCTLSASDVAIGNQGGFELNLFGCSLDFTAQWYRGSGLVNFYGCHCEMAAPKTAEPLFDVTDDGVLQFHGGSIMVSGNGFDPSPPNLAVFRLAGVRARAILNGVSVYNLRAAGGALAVGDGRLITRDLLGGPVRQISAVPMRGDAADLFGGAGRMEGGVIQIEADVSSSADDRGRYEAKYGAMAQAGGALVVSKSGGVGDELLARLFCPVGRLRMPILTMQWRVAGGGEGPVGGPVGGPVWVTLLAVQKIGADRLGRAVLGASAPMGPLRTLNPAPGGGWSGLEIDTLSLDPSDAADGCVPVWATHLCVRLELINLPQGAAFMIRDLAAYAD